MTEVVRLTPQFIDAAVKVHLDAFRGYANAKLGARYTRHFLLWFSRRDDTIALVAVEDGEVLGYVVGAPAGYGSAMNRELFRVVAFESLLRPWLIADRRFMRAVRAKLKGIFGRTPVVQQAPALEGPVLSLVGIGTSSAHRGRGAGMLLMNEFERVARQKGFRTLRLTVYPDNTAARRVYERSGWSAEPPVPGAAVIYTKRLET